MFLAILLGIKLRLLMIFRVCKAFPFPRNNLFLLVLEPDFGSTVVLSMTVLGMLFLAGVPLKRFIAWTLALSALLATVALTAPYRLTRLMSFTDPWSDPLNSGWQLTQALIAFGNGGWLGVGLGNSIQKLFYLLKSILILFSRYWGRARCGWSSTDYRPFFFLSFASF